MSAVKSNNTKPEVMLHKALFKKSFRYSLHIKNIKGKPDTYLKKYNAIIFFHGCFWQGYSCKSGALPKTRTEFWQNKIESNKLRDSRVIKALTDQDYKVLIIWAVL